MQLEKIKPCPFCGNAFPFNYISAFTVVLECKCGIGISAYDGGCASVLYKRKELPEELKPHTYEPKLLRIKEGEKILEYPEHGYVGVDAIAALQHAGALKIWNKRTKDS